MRCSIVIIMKNINETHLNGYMNFTTPICIHDIPLKIYKLFFNQKKKGKWLEPNYNVNYLCSFKPQKQTINYSIQNIQKSKKHSQRGNWKTIKLLKM